MSAGRRDVAADVRAQAGTRNQFPGSRGTTPVDHRADAAFVLPQVRGRQSVADARGILTQSFRAAGIDGAALDARILVGHALGLDHAALAAQPERRLSDTEAAAIAALAQRRLAREPVARILGVKEFWGLPLALNADTLVPRPETETVVAAALDAVGPDRARPLRIADLGTGTGALLLALLSERPAAHGVATDISTAALDCASGNAASLGLGSRTAFVCCDQGTALAGGFDLVVSNPPYVARDTLATLQPEVRNHDPLRALDGGTDGLAAYRAIAADARRLLAPRGVLVLELGAGQAAPVSAILAGKGLVSVGAPRCDLAGCARALTVRRAPGPPP